MKRIKNIIGVLSFVLAIGQAAYAETSLQDILDEACQISNVTAVCQVSGLMQELGSNVEQFVGSGRDEVRRWLSGGLVNVANEVLGSVAAGIELPPEILQSLQEIVELPDQYRDDFEAAWSKVDELKRSLTNDLLEELRALMAHEGAGEPTATINGEEVDLQTLLGRAAEVPAPCAELMNASPMSDEYARLTRACNSEREAKRREITSFLDQVSGDAINYASSARDTAETAVRTEQAESELAGAEILANAQASAERLATNYSLLESAKEASSRAQELADNAQNASSTRAAVQVLAEGMAAMMESNVASLAAVQMSLAELAQQQVYTNQQINRVASETVKRVAAQRTDGLEDAATEAAYFKGMGEGFIEQGDSLLKSAERLFDTSCANTTRWWEEGCP